MIGALAWGLAWAADRPPEGVALLWGGGRTVEEGRAALADWEATAAAVDGWPTPAPGYPRLVESGRVPGLKPGFHVVLVGVCPAEAAGPVLAALRSASAGAWSRPVRAEPACPSGPAVGPTPEPAGLTVTFAYTWVIASMCHYPDYREIHRFTAGPEGLREETREEPPEEARTESIACGE